MTTETSDKAQSVSVVLAPEGKKEAQREVFGETLSVLANEFANLLVLDGDLANSTRADIFAEKQPAKFLQMGIAEQNLMGVAAGLATVGFIPFISTFAGVRGQAPSTRCAWSWRSPASTSRSPAAIPASSPARPVKPIRP